MTEHPGPVYDRVLLKLSGEAFQGKQGYGVDPDTATSIAREVVSAHSLGISMGVVIGGGNIFRGMQASADGMDRSMADTVGMLATVMNALVFQDALERENVPTRVK